MAAQIAVDAAPRRLALSAVQLARLLRRTGITLPPPFHVQPAAVQPAGAAPVHPSVAANLAVLAGGDLLIHVEATLPGGRARAVFAVAGPLGASLFALADGAVELSMFASVDLGRELIRAVPQPERSAAARIRESLGGAPPGPPAGRLPWAALAECDAARALVGRSGAATELGLTGAREALAADLAERTEGFLDCLVIGRRDLPGGRGGPDRRVGAAAGVAEIGVGQVVWACTDAGWVGLYPQTGPGGERVVDLRPVAREDLGTAVAPYVAQILRGADHVRH